MLKKLMDVPIIQAPMAGGASNPVLAAAVSNAGGLGFLAAGYKTAEEMYAEKLTETRQLTEEPFGVNVFVPSHEQIDEIALAHYRKKIEHEAIKIGTTIGEAFRDDDDWDHKIAILKEEKVAVVSFTFGCPEREIISGASTGRFISGCDGYECGRSKNSCWKRSKCLMCSRIGGRGTPRYF